MKSFEVHKLLIILVLNVSVFSFIEPFVKYAISILHILIHKHKDSPNRSHRQFTRWDTFFDSRALKLFS